MFGFKKKSKETFTEDNVTEETIIEETTLSDGEEEKVEQVENEIEEVESLPKTETGEFHLARALGKTESGLKNEFYAYQIKELMAKVVKIASPEEFFKGNGEAMANELIKYGVGEISVTPFSYQYCKNVEDKIGKNKLRFSAMLDYPLGQSSFRARVVEVREALKNGLDGITVAIPKPETFIATAGRVKPQLSKLSNLTKNRLGFALDADCPTETLKKALKAVEGIKAGHIALVVQKVSGETLTAAVKTALINKGNKKLYVYAGSLSPEELSSLIELKVDKVYLENAVDIGKALSEKFGVEM